MNTDNRDAFGHTKYERSEGQDNLSSSQMWDSIRNIDLDNGGNIDKANETPTGKHSRPTASTGTGMVKDFLTLIIKILMFIRLLTLTIMGIQPEFCLVHQQVMNILPSQGTKIAGTAKRKPNGE